jgi:putative methyltransferase
VWGLQLASNYMVTLPVSLGTLWSYLSTKTDVFSKVRLTGWGIYHHMNDSVLSLLPNVDKNGFPDIVMVSLYMWNRNRTNKLTKAIKEKWPHVKIIVGGNDVPQDPERFKQFVKENPQYDYYVNSEGEIAFESILRKILKEQGLLDSEFYNDCFHEAKDGEIVKFAKIKRYLTHTEDLDYPSACAMGLYDNLIKELPDLEIQGVLETNRGCPYSCTFCDWGLEEKLRRFSMKRIKDELDWMIGNVHEIMFSDANFGILYRDLDIAKYLVKAKLSHPNPKLHSTAITYAKNNKERVVAIAEILEKFEFSRSGATFSLQSMNQDTLSAIKRDNMTITKDFDWIAKNFTERGIPYYHEMIMGMPMETKESFLTGMSKLLQYNPIEINVYKLALLENSEMSLNNHSEKYGLEWAKFEQGPSPFKDEKEYVYIINKSNTISFDDMKYIRDIRDMIQILWLGKSIFYLGRYLQKEHNIEACELIEKLYTWTKTGPNKEFWNVFYSSKEDILRVSHYKNNPIWYKFGTDRHKFMRYTNAWLYLHGSIERKNQFYDDITLFFKNNYPQLPTEILYDLVNFNKNILIDGENVNQHHQFETKYSWIDYFISYRLVKSKTTYDTKIEIAGNAKIPYSVGKERFLYYVAGGHDFMFNKQNAFGYPEGVYINDDKGRVNFISKVGTFFAADTYFETADDILSKILLEKDIDQV